MIIGNREFDTEKNTYIMGILNVTPDSFSDGGKYNGMEQALRHAQKMIAEGADLIDVGGESTRPGHVQISDEEEIARVTPVIEALKKEFDIPISIDTYKSHVAEAALQAGADLVNDIWGLKYDEKMAEVIAKYHAACCLMHNREKAEYEEFQKDFIEDMKECVRLAKEAGIADEKIILDPGVGFGKTYEMNLEIGTELLKLCGLEGDDNTPVIGIVTRFVDQKGLDLVEAVLPDILEDDVRLIVLGTGDWKYEQMFIEAKRRWPEKVSASIMFSGDLANRIYAGADMFLMPSKFEPCGLAQMIALRYGNIPIVRETGGLKDTVHAFVDYAGTGNGFSFASYNAHDMLHVIREACGVFRFNKPAWKKLMVQGMESDFSWDSSADRYIEVYHTALGW